MQGDTKARTLEARVHIWGIGELSRVDAMSSCTEATESRRGSLPCLCLASAIVCALGRRCRARALLRRRAKGLRRCRAKALRRCRAKALRRCLAKALYNWHADAEQKHNGYDHRPVQQATDTRIHTGTPVQTTYSDDIVRIVNYTLFDYIPRLFILGAVSGG
jgi:hypothetical protein